MTPTEKLERNDQQVSEVENNDKKADRVDAKDVAKEAKETVVTPEQFSKYQTDAKYLYKFLINSKDTTFYVKGMFTVKDQDMPQEIAKYDWPQLENMIKQYNSSNTQKQIDSENFKQVSSTLKPKKLIGFDQSSSTEKAEGDHTSQEIQKVGEFVISDSQKQKISGDIHNIVDRQFQVSEIILRGVAEATKVTEKGQELSVSFIKDQLTLLKDKGFDISSLPTLESFKQQYQEQEAKNPGNVQFAYGRALMQISHLSAQDLALLKKVPVIIKLDLDSDHKGHEYTQGGVEFTGHAGKETLAPIYKEINDIVNQWTNINFYVKYHEYDTDYAYGKELKPVTLNLYTRKVEEQTNTGDVNLKISNTTTEREMGSAFSGNNGPSYDILKRMTKPGEIYKSSEDGTNIYIAIPTDKVNSPEISSLIKKDLSQLTFADMYQLYYQFAPQNSKLDALKKSYDEYEALTAQLSQLLKDQKLN